MSSTTTLRRVASEICSKYGTLCFSESDPDDLVLFGFTWVENFYYIDPLDCASNLKCIETVFEMHSTIFKLAREGKYVVNIDRVLLEGAVKKLLELSKTLRVSA
ncbi:MAG: hypothetical protein ACO2OR_06550 [Desulfurococcaceae archaeon]